MKKTTKYFVLMLAVVFIFSLASCNLEELMPMIKDPEAKLEVMPDNNNNENHSFKGTVKNIKHDTLAGVEIFFGEDVVLASTTDENGDFTFYFKDPHNYTPLRASDFVVLDSEVYKFRIFIQSVIINGIGKEITCVIVADLKDSVFDIYSLVTPDYFIKMTFHQDNVVLPPGYVSRGYVYQEGGLSANGDVVLSGVELYANDNLVAISNDIGFMLDFIVPGDVLFFKKDGFTFVFRLGSTLTDLVDDTYIFTGLEGAMLEFRGITEDLNVLVN